MLRNLIIAIVVIGLDRFSKGWMVAHLMPYESVPICSFFNLTLSFNTGAAFSFLNAASGWQNMMFTSLAGVVSLAIIYWLATLSPREHWTAFALSLVLGGALGNAWDRVVYGYVIDFLDFHWHDWHFAIFNIADSAICIGAFILILQWASKPGRL